MLLAYDATGGVIATLDYMLARDPDGHVIGLIDFAAHEAAGGDLTDIWHVSTTTTEPDGSSVVEPASGSKFWPEYLGGQAHHYRVELVGPPGAKRVAALVHRTSGVRRERAAIEAAIAAVAPDAKGQRDITPIVGSPTRPLLVDGDGRTIAQSAAGTPAHLPILGARRDVGRT